MEDNWSMKSIAGLWFITVIGGVVAGYFGIIYLKSNIACLLTTILAYPLGVITVKTKVHGLLWLFDNEEVSSSEHRVKLAYAFFTAFIALSLMFLVVGILDVL